MSENEKEVKKIIFCGLDNSGKSSYIARLKNVEYPLRPTTGVERVEYDLLGFPIMMWDFGGQKNLRESQMKKTHFFNKTDLLFYLIDIQDEDRFGESILYFKELLNIFNFTEKPIVLVCFHKVDPDIANSQKVLDNTKLIKNIIEVPLKEFKYYYFSTTIFDYHSVLVPFSFAVSKIIPFSRIVETFLEKFYREHQLACLLLIDKNGAIIGKLAGPTEADADDLAYCQLTASYLAQLFEAYNKRLMPTPELSLRLIKELESEGSVALMLFEQIVIYKMRYYLIILTRNLEKVIAIKEALPEFISGLSRTIEMSY